MFEKEIEILKNGGIGVFPTDTVYGVGTDGLDAEAIKKIYEVKNRPFDRPINLLVNSIEMIEKIAYINDIERQIIEEYMPGAVTLILKKKEIVPDILTNNLDTVGVRIPECEDVLKLIDGLNRPLAASSANISDLEPAVSFEGAKKYFENNVDFIIDGGNSKIGIASTIVKVDGSRVEVLRKGSIKF